MDQFSVEKRSEIMSGVRGHGNKLTELALASILRENHITGWRRKMNLFGKPDFVFRRQHLAVFVDGCFWHGCPHHGSCPSTNRLFWEQKLKRNRDRDKLVNLTLMRSGWRVLRIWQHELSLKNRAALLDRIRQGLNGPASRD